MAIGPHGDGGLFGGVGGYVEAARLGSQRERHGDAGDGEVDHGSPHSGACQPEIRPWRCAINWPQTPVTSATPTAISTTPPVRMTATAWRRATANTRNAR